MNTRYEKWPARGVPATRRGRNLAIRNRVNSIAWSLVQAQTPPNLNAMLEEWRQMGWRFFTAPHTATDLSHMGMLTIEHLTLIQDYPESGQRCQDIELFTQSLYQRQIGRLIAPSTHRGVDLVMAWINQAYGHLRIGRRILHPFVMRFSLPPARYPCILANRTQSERHSKRARPIRRATGCPVWV